MTDRFELRTGRFGQYFYDASNHTDVDLSTALKYLNAYGEYVAQDVKEIINGIEALQEKKEWKVYSNRALQTFCYYCDEELTDLNQKHKCFRDDSK